jgi:hypothetical protein
MRIASTILMVLAAATAAHAQGDLEAARDRKLQQPFIKKAKWHFDYDLARAEAKKTGKAIFTYFTVSYDD